MIRKVFDKGTSKKLDSIAAAVALKTVVDFTHSNTIGLLQEVERYREITDYFGQKSNRERYNNTNTKYLDAIRVRLLEINNGTEHISDLCSKMINKFKAGII